MTTSTYQPGKLSPPFRPAKVGDRYTVTRGSLTQNFVYIQGPDGPTAVEDLRPGEESFNDSDCNLRGESMYHTAVGHKDHKAAPSPFGNLRSGLRAGAGRDIMGPMNGTRTHTPIPKVSFSAPTFASAKQTAYIRDLLAKVDGTNDTVIQVRAKLNGERVVDGQVSSKTARWAIDTLLALSKAPGAPQARQGVSRTDGKPNRRGQKCEGCGEWVEALQGVLELDGSKWLVFHKEGECPVGGVEGIPAGYYALVIDGTTKFYRLTPTGKLMVQASDDFYPIKSAETRTEVLDLIRANPEAAGTLYGQEIGSCCRCHRTLTDDESRAAGIGPICSQRGWA